MMTRKLHTPPISAKAQSGAVLAVSLLILIVLTIIGVASVNGSILELLMASNTQNQIKALNNAESTLLLAQKEAVGKGSITVVGGMLDCGDTTVGAYSTANNQCNGATGTFIDPTALNWDGTDSVQGKDQYNRYIIESLGRTGFAAECSGDMENTDCTSNFWVYRVTTRGTDARGTKRMVQSIWNNRIN